VTAPTVDHTHDGPDLCLWCDLGHDGRHAAEQGAAALHRDLPWWQEADLWLELQPLGTLFTADDLVSMIGKPHGSPNQIGARLRSWARTRAIHPHGYIEASRKESHGRVIRVWEVRS
jgi:hypothetical protein